MFVCVCVGRGDAAGAYRCVYRAGNAVSGRISGETCNFELPTHTLTTLHTQQRMYTMTMYILNYYISFSYTTAYLHKDNVHFK